MIPFISSALALLLSPIKHFIHEDFHHVFHRMPLTDKFLFMIIHGADKLGIHWYRLPVFLGLIYLAIRRYLHDEYNLLNVGKTPVGVRFNPGDFPFRTADGKFNDPFNEGAGSEGTFFGRNMPPVDHNDNKGKRGSTGKGRWLTSVLFKAGGSCRCWGFNGTKNQPSSTLGNYPRQELVGIYWSCTL